MSEKIYSEEDQFIVDELLADLESTPLNERELPLIALGEEIYTVNKVIEEIRNGSEIAKAIIEDQKKFNF